MTGGEIQRIRTEFALNVQQFATMLGVHPSTVYRWESALSLESNPDPLQRDLLQALDRIVRFGAADRLREHLRWWIASGGGLLALYGLLKFMYTGEVLNFSPTRP